MRREAFLARVRASAAAGRAHRVFPADKPLPPIPVCVPPSDLVAQMAAEVDRAGGRSHVVAGLPAAHDAIAALLDLSGAAQALCWRDPLLEQLDLSDLLQQRGIVLLDYDALVQQPLERRKPLMLEAGIGISGATWAIAQTGSLVMASRAGCERLASLAPPLHVAVIESRQIVADLFAVFSRYEAGTLPTNLTFITGPSKTGDIELELTTGVHGPGQWHVIIIES